MKTLIKICPGCHLPPSHTVTQIEDGPKLTLIALTCLNKECKFDDYTAVATIHWDRNPTHQDIDKRIHDAVSRWNERYAPSLTVEYTMELNL